MNFELVPLDHIFLSEAAMMERECFSMPWSRSMLEEELVNPCAFYLVALFDGQMTGYAGMHIILDEGYITNIAVSPLFRRQGVATALLKALIDEARLRMLAFVTLEVRAGNVPAITLYEKFGFIKSGTRKAYYSLPDEDAYIMTLVLTK